MWFNAVLTSPVIPETLIVDSRRLRELLGDEVR
jgi:hypothetical protein